MLLILVYANASYPIRVTLSGIVIFSILVDSNAPSPISFNEELSSNVTEVNPLPLNASSPIYTTLLGITTDSILAPPAAPPAISIVSALIDLVYLYG